MGIIYLAQNKVNGKGYVGQTIGTLLNRRRGHESAARLGVSSTHFHKAIRKYGVDAFEWSVIFDDVADWEIDTLEIEAVSVYRTLVPLGYNLTGGGSSNFKVTEITREKQRKVALNRSVSVRQNMSVAHHNSVAVKQRDALLRGRSHVEQYGVELADRMRKANSHAQSNRDPAFQQAQTEAIRIAMARPDVKEKIKATRMHIRQHKIDLLAPFVCLACNQEFVPKPHYRYSDLVNSRPKYCSHGCSNSTEVARARGALSLGKGKGSRNAEFCGRDVG